VVITDNCLGASDTINIGYLNDFTVNLGPDTLLCEGKTLTLNATTPYCDYLWQDGSTQPTYLVRGPGTYSVEVSNKCFSHWDAVNIDYEHCAQELYLPNAFTPNDDGKNQVFLPVFSYPDEIEEYRMEIYNRWGTLVFRTEEKSFGWDGANAINGVYAVVVHYKTRGEKEKTVKGNVVVVR
jgi:gliding motility-associated-like protein